MLRIVFQLIVFVGVSFSARSQTFYTLYSTANLTYRDLSPNGNGVGGSLEAFFRSRREAENPVIREKIGFGIGTFIDSNMQFQTGTTGELERERKRPCGDKVHLQGSIMTYRQVKNEFGH